MITINYEGKTYKTKETDWVIPNAIDSWIEMGALEEVKENKEPQFTPGQEIEVSNDGEKWEKREFRYFRGGIAIGSPKEYQTIREYMEDGSRIVSHESWKFARTIDKIELPEFKYQHEEYGVCPEIKWTKQNIADKSCDLYL